MKGTCASILLVKPLPFSFSFHSSLGLCKKTKKWILFSREKHFQIDIVESAAKGTNLVKQAASFVCSRKRWRKKNETSCLWKRDSWEFYFNATPKKNSRFIRTLVHSIYIAFTHTAFVEKKTYRDSQHTSDNHGLAFLAGRRKIFDDKLNKVSSIGSGWWKKDPLDGNVHPVFLGKHFCAICRLLREKSLAGKPSSLSARRRVSSKVSEEYKDLNDGRNLGGLEEKSELKEGNSERQLCWGGEAGTRRNSHCRFNFRFLAKHHHTRTRRAAELLGLLLLNSIFYAPRL